MSCLVGINTCKAGPEYPDAGAADYFELDSSLTILYSIIGISSVWFSEDFYTCF